MAAETVMGLLNTNYVERPLNNSKLRTPNIYVYCNTKEAVLFCSPLLQYNQILVHFIALNVLVIYFNCLCIVT